MAALWDDAHLSTIDLWESVKIRIFRTFTIWEIIKSKVLTHQPDNPTKRLQRTFEEIEAILDMFQMEISHSCRITINEKAVRDSKCITPDKNISKLLGVSSQNTQIYLVSGAGNDEADSAYDASQLVKVQLDKSVVDVPRSLNGDKLINKKDLLEEDGDPDVSRIGTELVQVLVKTEIKSEASDIEDDLEPTFEHDDEEASLVRNMKGKTRARKEKLALLRSQEYWPSFPVSKNEFEMMKAGKIERKCPRCEKTFDKKFEMIRHFRAKKRDCGKEYVAPRHDLYIMFTDEDTGKTNYACSSPNCAMSDKTWKGMTQVFHHWEEVHSDTIDLPIVCEHCPTDSKKRFLVSATLNKHIAWAHPEKVGREHKCKICGKKMNNAKKLQRHERTHNKDDIKKEDYRYRPEFPVPEHEYEQMNAGKIPRKCPKCNKTFNCSLLMVRHFSMKRRDCSSFVQVRSDLCIQVKDEVTGKTKFACAFPNCPDSGKTWPAKGQVNQHWESKHSDSIDLPVVCDYCPKRFLLTATQTAHMRTMHAEKLGLEFSCSKCGKKVKNMKSLIMHEKSHTTGKLFQCDFCDYRTNTQGQKNQHMRYNHADRLGIEVKLYQCEQCGKEFRNSSNLRQHVESAHSDRPDPKYQCQICSKQLKQDNSYRKHMANVHGVGERCTLCNKLYKNKEALEKHLKIVH